MRFTLVTPPALEPLTVLEAKRHLRIDDTGAEPTPLAPTVVLAGSGAGNVTNGTHRYRATFVTPEGETDGGDISAPVTVVDQGVNGRVAVSGIPIGGSRVTARRLYRTTAGGSTYLLLATIADNVTTTYEDNIADAGLGAGVPSTNTTEDPEILSLIVAAREHVEGETGRALVTQTWDYFLDEFPAYVDESINLPLPPLQSVSSVSYIDPDGATQTMPSSDYGIDTSSFYGAVVLGADKVWPVVQPLRRNAVTVRFVAGYGAPAAVPAPLKAAMKLLIGDLYGLRSAGIVGTIHAVNPAVDRLLSRYVVRRVA